MVSLLPPGFTWLTEDGVPRCALFPSSNLGPFGRCGGTREAGSTVTKSLVALYWVGTHQIRRMWKTARSSTSRGSTEPLWARIKGANREVSEGKAYVWPRSLFFLRGPITNGERARFVGLFQRCTGLWTARCWLARRLHHLKASTTMGLGILIFHISVRSVALRNLDLLTKTDWSVNCPLCCWERWPWVGDNNPSQPRLLSIWSKEVWWTVLTLIGVIAGRVAWLFVAIWIPVGPSSGLSPWCDPLTFVPLCDYERDWYLVGLWLTCCFP